MSSKTAGGAKPGASSKGVTNQSINHFT
jgi:hypothetical protein